VDGTRRYTLDKALLAAKVEEIIGKVPFIMIINKSDLTEDWEIDDVVLDELSHRGWTVVKGAQKTGLGVEESFLTLAEKVVEG